VNMGSNKFFDVEKLIMIHNEEMLTLRREGENLLLSALFYDKFGNLKISIRDNFWEAPIDIADIRYSEGSQGTDYWLSIRIDESEGYLELKSTKGELEIKGKFWCGTKQFMIDSRGLFSAIGNSLNFAGTVFRGDSIAFNIEPSKDNQQRSFFRIGEWTPSIESIREENEEKSA
jgi:hypothetical protein